MNKRELYKCNELLPELEKLKDFKKSELHSMVPIPIYKLKKTSFGVYDKSIFVSIDFRFVMEAVDKQIVKIEKELKLLGYSE
jgi:hypothetical protein